MKLTSSLDYVPHAGSLGHASGPFCSAPAMPYPQVSAPRNVGSHTQQADSRSPIFTMVLFFSLLLLGWLSPASCPDPSENMPSIMRRRRGSPCGGGSRGSALDLLSRSCLTPSLISAVLLCDTLHSTGQAGEPGQPPPCAHRLKMPKCHPPVPTTVLTSFCVCSPVFSDATGISVERRKDWRECGHELKGPEVHEIQTLYSDINLVEFILNSVQFNSVG